MSEFHETAPDHTAKASEALWKVVEETIADLHQDKDRFVREARLQVERSMLPSLPTKVNLVAELTDPIAIWRVITLGRECQALEGHDEMMLVIHKMMPNVVSWGLQVALTRLANIRKEGCKPAEAQATATDSSTP